MLFEVSLALLTETSNLKTRVSEMDMVERYAVESIQKKVEAYDVLVSIIREATAKSKDGRIDQSDFLNHAAARSRYSLFTPMEASIIFHFAGRGNGEKRLAVVDFAQLLDPRWRHPREEVDGKVEASRPFLTELLQSAYNFVQGGQRPDNCKRMLLNRL